MNKLSIEQIEQAIVQAKPQDQRKLLAKLAKLSRLLKLPPEDLAWLRMAEPSFEFWNNPEDESYDQL